ncbi:MAG: hypothetical protein RMJ33_11545 [Saprospiraceae bacterium]|nr:hypothetical protein [Saprospiraceae bacterium]MDW8230463.1 hypothetical protein [Saprospiraceae bacterium]
MPPPTFSSIILTGIPSWQAGRVYVLFVRMVDVGDRALRLFHPMNRVVTGW